jgi:(1->4)-alpha-D-glucan 1-alpha-D-glucosylmutase
MTAAIDEQAAALVDELAHGPRIRPSSTYRLQLSPGFDFRAAAARVPYLARLGISHIYLSPIYAAAPGSTHGYDVVDHNLLRPELGGDAGFAELTAAARALGLGILVDFVPNHMGIGAANPMWLDVLENGPSSQHAPFFDVDWKPVKHELENKVLVPLLGDQFGDVLERGELRLVRDGGTFQIAYFDNRFPVAPRSIPRVIGHRLHELRERLGADDHALQELLSIITALEKMPPRSVIDPATVAERAREKEVAKRRLAALFESSPTIRGHVDENLRIFNGTVGDPASFDLLEGLLDGQAYRLAHWRVAGEEINYRRFFDINDLAAIRMEDDRVFARAHRMLLRLLVEGKVHGVRIDHPDGLYAPTAYFAALQDAYAVEACLARVAEAEREALQPALAAAVARARAEGRRTRPLYVVVEKILEGSERMPVAWCVDGTTGYDVLNAVGGLFVDRQNVRAWNAVFWRFIGARPDFGELVYDAKKLIMATSMASEINMLAHRLNRLSETNRRTRDFTLNALNEALIEYIACLPIYRTYIDGHDIDPRDREYVEQTVGRARRRARALAPSIFAFLRDTLLLRHSPNATEWQKRDQLELVRKLQQLTGPVTAKAVEDTAFYRYNRLVALNEVGGDPQAFGTEPAELHALLGERLESWPGSLNTTSTHDTKRSEDVRVRIAALSEVPAEWAEQLRRWARTNRPHKVTIDGALCPDRNDELLLYQTLVGAFPDEGVTRDFVARIQAYMDKALKEAKVHTTWTNPNVGYDQAMHAFVAQVLESAQFLADFVPFQAKVARAALLSSLAQTAVKLVAPGVPDVYQGCELIDLSLVDPDNRRPVDWARREAALSEIERRRATDEGRLELARAYATGAPLADGRAKLLLLVSGLALRRRAPELFAEGAYLPLHVEGPHADHVVACARRRAGAIAICVVPRLVLGVGADAPGFAWQGRVHLPRDLGRALRCAVSGATLRPRGDVMTLAECFSHFPVTLLEG